MRRRPRYLIELEVRQIEEGGGVPVVVDGAWLDLFLAGKIPAPPKPGKPLKPVGPPLPPPPGSLGSLMAWSRGNH